MQPIRWPKYRFTVILYLSAKISIEKAPTKDSNIFTFFLAQTLALILAFTPTQAFVPIPCLLNIYSNVNLQKTIRLVLELFVKG